MAKTEVIFVHGWARFRTLTVREGRNSKYVIQIKDAGQLGRREKQEGERQRKSERERERERQKERAKDMSF